MSWLQIKPKYTPSKREKMLQTENGSYRGSLKECSRWMFDNKYACDVIFRVRNYDNTENLVMAHKFILLSRSPVFRAMFCGPLATNDDVIDVPDIQLEPFQEFLKFLYCDEIHADNSNVFELLYCAKKYMIPLMEVKCLSYVRENLDVENVCSILDYSLQYDEEELKDDCVKFIKASTAKVLKTSAFLECNVNVLKVIIEQDVLNVTAECDILQALLAWAQRACELKDLEPTKANLRMVLGSVLYSVRLTSLQSKTQETLIGTGFLDQDEETTVVDHISGKCLHDCPFIHTKRFFLDQTHCCLLAQDRFMSYTFLAGNVMKMELTTNTSVRILSVDILQIDMTVPVAVYFVIAVIQDGEVVGKVGIDKSRRPKISDKEVKGRSYINVPFPSPAQISSGPFTIEVQIQACHNFVSIATANPRKEPVTQGSAVFAITSDNCSCLRALHYAHGI